MELKINTSKHNELTDITKQIKEFIKKSKIKDGALLIYTKHTTAAITINENADKNIKEDILKAIDRVIPEHDHYKHDRIDNNAAGHIKSTIVGPSEVIPIKNSELQLGQWQNVFLCEFNGPRERTVILKILS